MFLIILQKTSSPTPSPGKEKGVEFFPLLQGEGQGEV